MNEPLTLQELVRMNGQQVWAGEPFNDWVKLIIGPYGIPSSMPPVKLYRAKPDTFVEEGMLTMERMTSWNGDCVQINGHGLHGVTRLELVQMADRLARYEDADSPMMRIRPGDTVWLSQMFYTRPKKPIPVTVDAIRIDREGVMFITGQRRFSEEAIGKTVFLSKEEAEKALQEMED